MRARLQVDGRWCRGVDLVRRLVANSLKEVVPVLEQAEREAEKGHWLVGWVAYDAAPAFDRALVARRRRGQPLVAFGVYKSMAPASPPREKGFATGTWRTGMGEATYMDKVRAVKDLIASGDTYQVNLTLPLQTSFEGDPAGLFAQLVNAQPVEFAAYLEWEHLAVCCASPELFFSRTRTRHGSRIVTRPMKGTAARHPQALIDRRHAAALRRSIKDRAENVMIVDMLRNDLGRMARPGTVRVPELFRIETYPTVHQMTTVVEAETGPGVGLPDMFAALFPCASITGAPKVRTMEIIRDLEVGPRGLYCGAIGLIRPGGDATFSVVIRTAIVDRERGTARYGVGGGVVWDSDPAAEWRECRVKTGVLREQPAERRLLETLYWSPKTGPRNWQLHRARLVRSANYFGFHLDLPGIEAAINDLRTSEREAKRLRILSARSGAFELEAQELPPPVVAPWELPLDRVPVDPANVDLYHKTTRRSVYREARARHPESPDVVLTNTRGEVTETTIGNVLYQIEGSHDWYTPPVRSGLLAGVHRERLLQAGEILERPLLVSELERCSLAIANSLRGVFPVRLVLED